MGPPLTSNDQQPHSNHCQGTQQVLAHTEPIITTVWCSLVWGRGDSGGPSMGLVALPPPQPLHVTVTAGTAHVLHCWP